MTDPVPVVGIGPGNLDSLTPRGRHLIAEADVLLGYDTVISFIESETDATLLRCSYDTEAERLDEFTDHVDAGHQAAAVAMGDPTVSGLQFVDTIDAALDRPIEHIPGISSIQVATSRARIPVEDSTFVTLHKRGPIDDDLARLGRDAGTRHLIVLPRPGDFMPADIADYLLDSGVPHQLPTTVYERLTHENESATTNTLGALAETTESFSDLSVLIVERDR